MSCLTRSRSVCSIESVFFVLQVWRTDAATAMARYPVLPPASGISTQDTAVSFAPSDQTTGSAQNGEGRQPFMRPGELQLPQEEAGDSAEGLQGVGRVAQGGAEGVHTGAGQWAVPVLDLAGHGRAGNYALSSHAGPITSLAFLGMGAASHLVSGSVDESIRVWDISSALMPHKVDHLQVRLAPMHCTALHD